MLAVLAMELVAFGIVGRHERHTAESEAEIRLEAPDGKLADRTRSGFV